MQYKGTGGQMRRAEIRMHEVIAGLLTQDENGYNFIYDKKYIESENHEHKK